MPSPPDFKEEDKIKMLLWSDRHCCLCKKICGTNIEIAHIEKSTGNNIDNGIPLCFECHSEIGRYNKEHPKGNKYKSKELKARREQVYEEYTRHLVPPIHFLLNQTRADGKSKHKIPFVGFQLQHVSDSLPVSVRVEAKIILDGKDLGLVNDPSGYYTGKAKWNINPRTLVWGGLSIPKENFEGDKELKLEIRVTVVDQFEREHKLLPQCFRYIKEGDFWNLEPRSFTEWK